MREWDLKMAHPRPQGKSKLYLGYSRSHNSCYLLREVKERGCTEITGNQVPITGKKGSVSHGEVWRTTAAEWAQDISEGGVCNCSCPKTTVHVKVRTLALEADTPVWIPPLQILSCVTLAMSLNLWANISTSMRWSSHYLCHRRSYKKQII